MNIFGMGTLEMLVILVVALIVFGPGRLPEVASQVGKWVRDFRRMTADLTSEFERTAGVQDIKRAVQGELTSVRSEVSAVTDSVRRDLNSAASSVNRTVSSAAASASGKPAASTGGTTKVTSATAQRSPSTTAKTGVTTPTTATTEPPRPKASKKDPLADVSFFEGASSTPTTNGPAAPAVTRPAAKATLAETNGSTGGLSPDQADALKRARQRRLAAGYNRRS